MSAVKKYYGDLVVQYCAHRYEPDRLLTEIGALGFETVRHDTILENVFFKTGQKPAEISTLRSTALDTLAQLYGITPRVFSFDLDRINGVEKKFEFERLIQDYKNRSIDITHLAVN